AGAETKLELKNATINTTKNLNIGNGDQALTNINIESSEMNVGENARIGVGNGAVTKFNLNDGKISVSDELVLGQGDNTTTEMNIRKGDMSSKNLSIGDGKSTLVNMNIDNSMINIENNYSLAKGEKAEAKLAYNNSYINLGNGSIGTGVAANTELNLQKSKFNASKAITIGAGDESLTKINVSDNTYFGGREVSIGSGIRSTNAINIYGNSTFNFGTSVSSTIGEGDESNSVVVVNNGSIIGDGTLTLAKGARSQAELTLQENAITNANDITLAAGSDSKTVVNVLNSNAKQFNPRIMTAGKGFSEVNLDGPNGFELTTQFLCLENESCDETEINIKRGNVSLMSKHDWKGRINIYEEALLNAKNDYAVNGTINIKNNSMLNVNGFNQNVVSINNLGTLKLSSGSASANLNIEKDYYGEDGSKINFGVFGKRNADEMHVNGDTVGQSALVLDVNNNIRRKKAGSILLIEVGGKSDGHFYLESLNKQGVKYNVTNDYITVGAWEYELNKKRKNWYLDVNMRPEPGAFINNSKSMFNMFGLQRYDIPGQHIYPSLFENLYNNGVWIRYDHASGKNEEEYANLASKYSFGTVMLGADIYNWTDGYNYSQIGLMGGVGSAKNTTVSTNNKVATGRVNGYTAGVYHTYQQNITDGLRDSERQGLWTYAALQYMSYTNSVYSTNKFDADYNTNGYKATGELGYLYNILETSYGDYYIEPKFYSSYTGLSGGIIKGKQGNEVKYSSENLNVEPGLRITYRKTKQSSSNSDSLFKDRIKQSVLEGWVGSGYSVDLIKGEKATFDSDEVNYKQNTNIVLTGGVEAAVSKSARVQVTAKYLLNNERDFNLMFGGMYRF
ncbi:autotransporter outer membrane beta-barrel domain-containing protein, partial [Citrobacter werkmanii]|uniref:autotransporter outer membrane beta-barrel domain-containing protein n=1 Tax=Citrobacter werkmanii TaxID=67827 RepID=UPI001282A132|nr:autotransporter outer membrane beta-barrel domain-containing protein [Salmonella enterica]EAZ9261450.1 autotransporter outer membrane beta-barrel domain-containing protein [Salmonella enterica]